MRRASLVVVVALLTFSGCRCADTPGLTYACDPEGRCEDGRICVDGFCVVDMPQEDGGSDAGFDAGCLPTRVCTFEECDVVGDDGCGEDLDCGSCGLPFSCGLHEANRCGCDPVDAGSQVCPPSDAGAQQCGSITINNCGAFETFECGALTCPSGQDCSENLCCVPPTDLELCAEANFGCGRGIAIDRCGNRRTLDCPTCTGLMESCVYTDEGSMCVSLVCQPENDFELCNRRGANCGDLSAVDNCGTTRPVTCGGDCDAGKCDSTYPNQCTCQPVLAGCFDRDQCCSGHCYVDAGLCCTPPRGACGDDGECCNNGSCQQDAGCCLNAGGACGDGTVCCSGVCNGDGGCETLDAGYKSDGGEPENPPDDGGS